MDQLYREQIIDHYQNPHNTGTLDDATHTADLKNLSCGDEIKVDLVVKENKIENIKFEGEGCAVCIASTSLLSDEVKGSDIKLVQSMNFGDVQEIIGIELSPSRIKCGHLGLLTIQKALNNPAKI